MKLSTNVLVSAPQCSRITAELEKVAARFTADARMYSIGDPAERGQVISTADGVLVIDGHWTGWGEVDWLKLGDRTLMPGIKAKVLIVGGCDSGENAFTCQVREGLDRRVAYLGCAGRALYEHAELVFPPVLEALFSARDLSSADTATHILCRALAHIRADQPRKTSLARWAAQVLEPR
jgi:hypothetical protein